MDFKTQIRQMSRRLLSLEALWQTAGFNPNENQKTAILHVDGPLYLPAGPGSGKTRVLLWRTLNLLVFHEVKPEEIFLSTFTEKAALQLTEGLRSLLGLVSLYTDLAYDLSPMYIGTVHSLCRRLLTDRRFAPQRRRRQLPALLDDLSQYFFISRPYQWEPLTANLDLGETTEKIHESLNSVFGSASQSKHVAVTNIIGLFNRLSEECLQPANILDKAADPRLQAMLQMYGRYRSALAPSNAAPQTDFALLQQAADDLLLQTEVSGSIFKHIIIDEYQDTNTIQEKIFFHLADGHKNLCVVGDDDQALYRFRGATVENFVEFAKRCQDHFGQEPKEIPLDTNYRSRSKIVSLYSDFIQHHNWTRDGTTVQFRVPKDIKAYSGDDGPSVVASTPGKPENVCPEIAALCRQLIDTGKVANPNQIAFLFPSLKSDQVGRMRQALEAVGLEVYAPRAGRFLQVPEATALFGLFLQIFGQPERGDFPGDDYRDFHNWLDQAHSEAAHLMRSDRLLAQFVQARRKELESARSDYLSLLQVVEVNHWDLKAAYLPKTMKRILYTASGLSERAQGSLANVYFDRLVTRRQNEGRPVTLDYTLIRTTSIDWNVLDLFYRICGFEHFKTMFDAAECGDDEGPICNLGLISQYLSRFLDEYTPIITAKSLLDDKFQHLLVGSYLYVLFRRGESEYEDAEDPFPKGRIPFLTIHQSKGLEFPVVVFANPRKNDMGPQRVETLVRPLLERQSEPLNRMSGFDIMRMFYVALSRAKNLLVVAHYSSSGNWINQPLRSLLDQHAIRIPNFDVASVPPAADAKDDLPRSYSYTSDYLNYQKCPRQYMIFRKYGLVPSRSQTMIFGSLVHQTLEDLHHFLIASRNSPSGGE